MDKNGVLTIGDWQKGQADSPYLGFSLIKDCEVFETPGVLKIANRLVSSFTPASLPTCRLNTSSGTFIGTEGGTLYRNGVSFQTGLGFIYDIAEYKDYLYVTHGTSISRYGPLSVAPTWSAGWATGLAAGYYKKMLVGKDDAVYVTNGGLIGKINNSGWTSNALDLPEGQYACTLAELGKDLMIGTHAGSNWFDRINYRVANIYPWDRVSSSVRLPVTLNESGVHQLLSDNNRLYIVAGIRGNVYVTDSTNYVKIKRLPWNQSRNFGASVKFYPNAITMSNNNSLLIGTSTASDAYGSTGSSARHGVYEIQLTSGYPTVFKHTASDGTFGSATTFATGVLSLGAGDDLYMGWQSGSSYGFDTTDFRMYPDYAAVAESQLFEVGTRLERKTFQNIEFVLGKPLTTGQEIRISYRKNLTASYTTIGTFTFATLGAVISHNTNALISEAELVQIKVEITQPIIASFGENIELLRVRLW